MATPALATKLYIPPHRPQVVSRPRLIERLNEGLHRRLTLVSAPAGFGKTTLVSAWVASCQRPVAWLSLDEGDSDPARFLIYLVSALQTIAPDIGAGVLGVLQSPQPPIESVLTALLNEIAALPDPFVLVLDDYHVIDAPPVVVEDLVRLLATIPHVWKSRLTQPFILNPTFAGSPLVGGADADWIVDGVLYECKCSSKPRPFERRHLLQGVGYVLLDAYDEYALRHVAWYYARHQMWSLHHLPDLFKTLFGSKDIPALRHDFWAHVSPDIQPWTSFTRHAAAQAARHLQSVLTRVVPAIAPSIASERIILKTSIYSGIERIHVGERTISLVDRTCVVVMLARGRQSRLGFAVIPQNNDAWQWAWVRDLDPQGTDVECHPVVLNSTDLEIDR